MRSNPHTDTTNQADWFINYYTHTRRRLGTDSVDASLIELIKILSRWNGNVNMIASWYLLENV